MKFSNNYVYIKSANKISQR